MAAFTPIPYLPNEEEEEEELLLDCPFVEQKMFVTTFEIESLAMPSPVSDTVIWNPPDELVRDNFSVQRASDDDDEEDVVASIAFSSSSFRDW